MKSLKLSSTAMSLVMASVPGLASAAFKQYDHPLLLNELPSTGEEWTTIRDGGGVEVLPASNLSPLAQEHLRRLTSNSDAAAYTSIYKDGAEVYYDEYSQGWRVLGFYLDCDSNFLDGDDDDDDSTCPRYLLWAAYVDEGYSGHEVGEYQYYDRHSNQWSDYACREYNNTERCVKMDCHLPQTKFTLLGFFKEPEYRPFMEQLFKHEGDCVWTDDEFKFMQQERDDWPEQCTATGHTDSKGNTLYYDLRPSAGGSYDIGLYTDGACVVDYTEGEVSVPDVLDDIGDDDLYANGDGKDLLKDTLDLWNSAFDVFKQCQPCKAYKLTAVVAGMGYVANADGNRYADRVEGDNRRRKLQDDDDDGEFFCHDAAGARNVNQCMKFKTKTPMRTASFNDVMMASTQGTITQVTIKTGSSGTFSLHSATTSLGNNNGVSGWVYLYLAASALVFMATFLRFMVIYRQTSNGNLNDPLIATTANDVGVTA